MPTDAPHTALKIALAVAKHHVKKLVGDEAWELVGQEVVDAGGEQVTARLDAILGSREGAARLVEAGQKAGECFRQRCQDPDLLGAFSLSWGDLPSVQQALKDLPTAQDETDGSSRDAGQRHRGPPSQATRTVVRRHDLDQRYDAQGATGGLILTAPRILAV